MAKTKSNEDIRSPCLSPLAPLNSAEDSPLKYKEYKIDLTKFMINLIILWGK